MHAEAHMFDKNIPIPPRNATGARARSSKYPFARMEVGDSKFFPDAKIETMRGAAYSATMHDRSKRFTVRPMTEDGIEGVRVWRVEQ